jgi:hypothetical protein
LQPRTRQELLHSFAHLADDRLNRRTAEPQNKEPQNIEVKNIFLFLSKTSAVQNSLFDIQNSKQAESRFNHN